MRYVDNVVELIGDTPLVRLRNLTEGIEATVLAKVEYFNPGGSVKDRIAVRMVEEAEKAGLLGPRGTRVAPTSGNTGVGLALVAQAKGYKCVFVCPDKVSEDKRNVLKAYGAEVVVCPTARAPMSCGDRRRWRRKIRVPTTSCRIGWPVTFRARGSRTSTTTRTIRCLTTRAPDQGCGARTTDGTRQS